MVMKWVLISTHACDLDEAEFNPAVVGPFNSRREAVEHRSQIEGDCGPFYVGQMVAPDDGGPT